MPGTTPVYGFPYPEPTDLVADYPALGQQLAEDIEDVLPTLGGTRLVSPTSIANSGGSATSTNGTTTFTSVNSISLNGVFATTAHNYRIVLRVTPSTGNFSLCRFRASGTDNSANYTGTLIYNANGGAPAGATQGTTNFQIMGNSANDGASTFDVLSPFQPNQTIAVGSGYNRGGDFIVFAGAHNSSTQFDGITIYPNTGSISGTVRVYSYRGA